MMNRRYNEPEPITRHDVSVIVKWYNPAKGFGFVQFGDGTPDAFLHVSVVQQTGLDDLPEGTRLLCDIAEGPKGPQVAAVVRVEALAEVAPVARDAPTSRRGPAGEAIEGTVKFFSADKGFGFIVPDGGGKDVYVSARLLEQIGV